MHLTVRCFSVLALASVLSAQDYLVVPSAFASQDGNHRDLVPGILGPRREQLLIGPSHLVGLVGRSIQALEFRRHAFLEPFIGGSATFAVALSISPNAPLTSSTTFQSNIGPNPVQVFQGVVTAPNSPTPTANVGWTPDNVIRIAFQQSFLYTGGTLCIDMAGDKIPQQAQPFWTADAVLQNSDSSLLDLGPGTGPTANQLGRWSFVRQSELSPGSTVEMFACGADVNFCVAMVGHPSPVPIPLNAFGIGAPGAMCYLDEIYESQFVMLTIPEVSGPAMAGFDTTFGYMTLWLPNQPWFLGVEIGTQWLELTNWNVSNGIKWTVASTMPTLDMAMLHAHPTEATGQRTVNVAHIVRIEHTN